MNFYETITAAVADIEEHGYDSEYRVQGWISKIEEAAKVSSIPVQTVRESIAKLMFGIYSRMIEKGGISKLHRGIPKFTLQRLTPRLRSELDRRIMASANLIKLNREQMIFETIKRFNGWATSIPKGGSKITDTMEVKSNIKKSFSALPFEERRVLIDQGHKLTSGLSEIIALDSNAIAAEWNSHWRQPGYDYDPDHKEFDGKVFAIRGNWALEKGLMNKGAGYTDEIIRPAERPFCRCAYTYYYNLRDLPESMLTTKGKATLNHAA